MPAETACNQPSDEETGEGPTLEPTHAPIMSRARTLHARHGLAALAIAVQVQVARLAPSPPPTSPPPTSPDHCSVQDCERSLAEERAKYQQAVAAGQKDGQDRWCIFGGLWLDAMGAVDEYSACNCSIDNDLFKGVSDCPDLHARTERVCEKLRACADPDSGDSGPGLAIGLGLGGCLLVAMLAAAVFVWHRKRRKQPPQSSPSKQSSPSNAAPQQVKVAVAQN